LPVKTGSQIESRKYYLGGVADLREVRDDITIASIAQKMSNHIISSNIRPIEGFWQSNRWLQYINKNAYDVIGELLLNAIVYGQAIADVVVGVDRSLRYIVTDMIPLDMGLVQLKRQNEPKSDCDITAYLVHYGRQILDTSRLANLVFYTQGGSPSPLGLKFRGEVRRMNEACEIEHFATGSSALGDYYATDDGTGGFDGNAVIEFFKRKGNSMGTTAVLPGTNINQVPTAGNKKDIPDAFGVIYNRNELRILKQFNMEWTQSGQSDTPGTYGAMQASLEAYSKYIDSIANAVCGFFDQVSVIENRLSGLPPVQFIHDPVNVGKNVEDARQKIVNMMVSPLVAKGQFDKGIITDAESREALGLPPIEPKQEIVDGNTFTTTEILSLTQAGIMTTDEARAKLQLPVAIQQTTPANNNTVTRTNAVNTWLSQVKKEQVKQALDKAVKRKQSGLGKQFNFTEVDRLVATTSLDKETAKALVMNFETQAKTLIDDICDNNRTINDFDALWLEFETGVKNAIQ
jgi:hypothetical protein